MQHLLDLALKEAAWSVDFLSPFTVQPKSTRGFLFVLKSPAQAPLMNRTCLPFQRHMHGECTIGLWLPKQKDSSSPPQITPSCYSWHLSSYKLKVLQWFSKFGSFVAMNESWFMCFWKGIWSEKMLLLWKWRYAQYFVPKLQCNSRYPRLCLLL